MYGNTMNVYVLYANVNIEGTKTTSILTIQSVDFELTERQKANIEQRQKGNKDNDPVGISYDQL